MIADCVFIMMGCGYLSLELAMVSVNERYADIAVIGKKVNVLNAVGKTNSFFEAWW